MTTELRDQLQSTLGHSYELDRELGGGGMSRVFLATETAFGRQVVIKVLPPELVEGISVERFKREIALAAGLQHPHIVPVHAAGETNGLPYFTMPFVTGHSLRDRLARGGPLGATEAIGVMRDVAKALAYAHEHGVVHRDIKPDNVLLSGGSAVVTDFGVAKALSASKTVAPGGTLTQVGTSLGTPAYMAPEQAAADPDTDHRADLYAFGVMAYEMLAGHPPFHGRTPQKLLAAQMGERPEPIDHLRPDLPPLLAHIVMRCLEKEPDARPQSASDLVRVLDTVTSGGTHPAMPALLLGGRRRVGMVLTVYAIAFVVVALLAKAAIIAIGLPDWVFPGALIVMGLGLPVILLTAFVHHGTHRAMTMAALTPGGTPAAHSTMTRLAVKASPFVSWNRTAKGGAIALGGFAILVAAFMVMRAFGIGPVGSLLAAGKLSNRDKLLVTDFQSGAGDSSLSSVVTEAIRADLGQSSVVTVVPASSIADALVRMRRDRNTRVDLALAREIAAREGIKGIVDGSVTALAGGYVVSVKLVAAESGDDLASFRETIDGPSELIPTLGKLSDKLREKIGESLKTVRANPPLEQVTTSSLEALRKYAAGMRAFNIDANLPKAAELFREAVAIDTTFATAYRRLGVVLNNSAMPRESIDSALVRAYQFRDRLTDVERFQTTGSYFQSGPARDRKRAAEAYESLLEIDSLNEVAINNLGIILGTRRQFGRAESLLRRSVLAGSAPASTYLNLVDAQISQGKFLSADSTAELARSRFPDNYGVRMLDTRRMIAKGELDSLERRLKALDAADPDASLARNVPWVLRDVLVIRGRLAEAGAVSATAVARNAARGVPEVYGLAFQKARHAIMFRKLPERGVGELDAALAKIPFASVPVRQQRHLRAAPLYAMAGQPAKARAILADYATSVTDSALLREQVPDRHNALGEIALAEGRHADAIAEFKLADQLPDGPTGVCAKCVLGDLARGYNAAGMRDSAVAIMERYLAVPSPSVSPDDFYLARIHHRLGELYEEKRDSGRAIRHYQHFVELWKNADADLQPQVSDARERIARLTGTR